MAILEQPRDKEMVHAFRTLHRLANAHAELSERDELDYAAAEKLLRQVDGLSAYKILLRLKGSGVAYI
jgi:hypothetical protein